MKRLTTKEYIGYASASIGDAICYTFVGTFLMFFLTTVAGLAPATAGALTALGAIWDGAVNPVIGYWSDRVRSPLGRRRPLFMAFSFPLAAVLTLLFTAFPMSEAIKPLYYGAMILLFWVAFTGFFIPYYAMGADYTDDYDDRTKLRLYASIFNTIGTVLAMAAPSAIVAFFEGHGLTTAQSWTGVAGFLGILSAISILLTFRASKEKDPPCPPLPGESAVREKIHVMDIFREFLSILKLPPLRLLIFTSIAALIGYAIHVADMIYFFTFCLHLSPGQISGCLLLRAGISLAFLPVLGRIAKRLDKKPTIYLLSLFCATGLVTLRFVHSDSFLFILIYMIMLTLSVQGYWGLVPSMYYDVGDYDMMTTGHSRQGAIVSLQGLVEAVASGMGTLLLGILLQFAGFNGSLPAQNPSAQSMIFTCTTIVPAIFMVLTCLALWKYPITRERHAEIQRTLKKDAASGDDA